VVVLPIAIATRKGEIVVVKEKKQTETLGYLQVQYTLSFNILTYHTLNRFPPFC